MITMSSGNSAIWAIRLKIAEMNKWEEKIELLNLWLRCKKEG